MIQNGAGKQVFGAAESVGRSLFHFACLAVSGQKEGAGAGCSGFVTTRRL